MKKTLILTFIFLIFLAGFTLAECPGTKSCIYTGTGCPGTTISPESSYIYHCDLSCCSAGATACCTNEVQCTDECSIGARECPTSTYLRYCGDNDPDDCTEWITQTCTAGYTCENGYCVESCTESDAEFCLRLGKECNDVTANDICGDSRTVNCGTCGFTQTCSNGVCSTCMTEETYCFNKECGSFDDGCGGTINCGTCDSGFSCGDDPYYYCFEDGCTPEFSEMVEEKTCDDGIDNDCNGLKDCADTDSTYCQSAPQCCSPLYLEEFVPIPGLTNYFVKTCNSGNANWDNAKTTCTGLCSGCILPTKDQLQILYDNKDIIGAFVNNDYWSSTSAPTFNTAYKINFETGVLSSINKGFVWPSVRCIKYCTPTTEICDNSADEDCDGLVDSADPDCAAPCTDDIDCDPGYKCDDTSGTCVINCANILCSSYTEVTCPNNECCFWDIESTTPLCLPVEGSGAKYCIYDGVIEAIYGEECDPGTDSIPAKFKDKSTCLDGLIRTCDPYCDFSCQDPDCVGKTCGDFNITNCNAEKYCTILSPGCYLDVGDECKQCDGNMEFCEDYNNIDTCFINPCSLINGEKCKWDYDNSLCVVDTDLMTAYTDVGGNVISCSWDCSCTDWSDCVDGFRNRQLKEGCNEGEECIFTGDEADELGCISNKPPASTRQCVIAKEFSFFSEKSILIVFVLLITYYLYVNYKPKKKIRSKRKK